jgi:hypothetical protein
VKAEETRLVHFLGIRRRHPLRRKRNDIEG